MDGSSSFRSGEGVDNRGTPAVAREWLHRIREWITVLQNQFLPDLAVAKLGPGERGAIQLARRGRPTCFLWRFGARRAARFGGYQQRCRAFARHRFPVHPNAVPSD